MEKSTKYCKYSGEPFIPKRRDQKFASNQNRWAFHNDKQYANRERLRGFTQALLLNDRILEELIGNQNEVKAYLKDIISKGFDTSIMSGMIIHEKTRFSKMITYGYACHKDNDTITIIRIN